MKRILIAMLALSLLLCGCGKEEPKPTEPAAQTQSQTVATEPTEAPATEDPDGIPEGQEAVTEPSTGEKTVYLAVRMSVENADGEETGYETYTYDELGRRTGSQEVRTDGQSGTTTSTIYSENGDYVTVYTTGEFTYSVRNFLDEMGNVIRDEMVEDGEVTDTSERTFDQYGNQLTVKTDFGYFTYEYTYDENGNVTKRMEYQDGELMGWLEMTYDADERVSESTYYTADGKVSHGTSITWEGNTQTSSYRDADGEVYMMVMESFDDRGNTLFRETRQGDLVVSRVSYTYEPFQIPVD